MKKLMLLVHLRKKELVTVIKIEDGYSQVVHRILNCQISESKHPLYLLEIKIPDFWLFYDFKKNYCIWVFFTYGNFTFRSGLVLKKNTLNTLYILRFQLHLC